jgi:hypothetical protein
MNEDTNIRKRLNAYKIVIIILTFILFNPSENDHDNAVVFGYLDPTPNEEIQLRRKTTRINFLLFSLTKGSYLGESNWHIRGFGILGNVFIVN